MYLSQLKLDPRHRDTRDWLSDCHRLHRAIMLGFGEATSEEARAEFGVLFRVDNAADGEVRVLVQSREAPRWAFETNAVRDASLTKSLDGLEASMVEAARFRFGLRANPTRRIHKRALDGPDRRELDTAGNWRDAGEILEHERTGVARRREAEHGRAGQRVELTREEDRLAWLTRRGREQDGFELSVVRLVGGFESAGALVTREVPGTRADPGGRLQGRSPTMDRRLTFATALFEGELQITDAAAFRHAFEAGIGPGKAFGCGLLSLARVT